MINKEIIPTVHFQNDACMHRIFRVEIDLEKPFVWSELTQAQDPCRNRQRSFGDVPHKPTDGPMDRVQSGVRAI